jgi:hypothetical protein
MISKALLISFAPIAGSTLYLVWLHYSLTRKVQCKTTSGVQATTVTLPREILEKASEYVILHEKASKIVPTGILPQYDSPGALLTTYLRHTMTSFSYYPFTWIIRFLTKSPSDRVTFTPTYLQNLEFVEGDLVCGVYRVAKRTPDTVELIFDTSGSYKGPPMHGMLAVGIDEREEQTTFLNEVFMWRGKNERPVPLEGFGRWIHTIIATSLVESGTQKLIKSAET